MIRAALRLRRGTFDLDVAFETTNARGEIVGLFGASGSGKSTIVESIAGTVRPDAGRIECDGVAFFDRTRGINVPPHRRTVGVVFQDLRLFPHHTVDANLRYGMPAAGGPIPFDSVVDLLELAPLLGRRPERLSGGERQRVALGRALLRQPKVLLCDEPLAALDRRLRREILPVVRRVLTSLAIPTIWVSHDLAELLQLTERMVLLDRGRVVGAGDYADLLHDGASAAVLGGGHLGSDRPEGDQGMMNLLEGEVTAIDRAAGSATVQLADEIALTLPFVDAAIGARLHISVLARDIALASGPVGRLSIQNRLAGRVRRVTRLERGAIVDIVLGADGPVVAVDVSHRAVDELGLVDGAAITCLIKRQAIAIV
jgi:molybdate transport system ATP-binding protein